MDDNKLFITMEDGSEKEMTILFTFYSDEYGKNYVVFYDPEDPEGQSYAMSYDEQGNMDAIEDDKEFDMVMEVFGSFQEDEQQEEE